MKEPFFLIIIFLLLGIGCTFQKKKKVSNLYPEVETYVQVPQYLLRYGVDMSLCDNEWISIARPPSITLSHDAEFRVFVEDDTIKNIRLYKGHFLDPIKQIFDFNSFEFWFRLSDFTCVEEYKKYSPGIRLSFVTQKGGVRDIDFRIKGNDISNICD